MRASGAACLPQARASLAMQGSPRLTSPARARRAGGTMATRRRRWPTGRSSLTTIRGTTRTSRPSASRCRRPRRRRGRSTAPWTWTMSLSCSAASSGAHRAAPGRLVASGQAAPLLLLRRGLCAPISARRHDIRADSQRQILRVSACPDARGSGLFFPLPLNKALLESSVCTALRLLNGPPPVPCGREQQREAYAAPRLAPV
jgi:hypothetical protein